jgi:hypothetical protein
MQQSSTSAPLFSESDEDQLGFVTGLAFALPISLALWAMAIWAAFRFVF